MSSPKDCSGERNALTGWSASVAFTCAAFLLAVLVVDPRGNFPLNDDWNFALATWHFAETGKVMLSRFSAMTLKTQILWGAAWTRLFGESHSVLRASTLFLSLATLLLLDSLLRRLRVRLSLRIVTVAVFLFNPLFLWSSFTYMTQVPYVFLSLAAMYFAWRGMNEERLWLTCAAAAAITASYFLRQTGLSNGLAALSLFALNYHRSHSRRTLALAFPIALSVAAFAVLYLFTNVLDGYPHQIENHFLVWHQAPMKLAKYLVLVPTVWTVVNLQLFALFVSPLVVPLALFAFPRLRRSWFAAAMVTMLFVAVVSHLVATIGFVPYHTPGNIWINFGLGPPTLRDTWVFRLPYPWTLAESARAFLTAFSVVAGASLPVIIASRWRELGSPAARNFAIIAVLHSIFATSLLFVSGIYFDRYVLDSTWSLTIVAALLLPWERWAVRATAIAVLVPIAFFSVFGVQEYLRWNGKRWEAFRWLQSKGVTLRQMDGGYEINQYLLGGFNGTQNLRKIGFSVVDDEYIIALNPVAGYRTIGTFPFTSFAGLRHGAVRAERRIANNATRVRLPDGTVCDPSLIDGCGAAIIEANERRPTLLWLEEDQRLPDSNRSGD